MCPTTHSSENSTTQPASTVEYSFTHLELALISSSELYSELDVPYAGGERRAAQQDGHAVTVAGPTAGTEKYLSVSKKIFSKAQKSHKAKKFHFDCKSMSSIE